MFDNILGQGAASLLVSDIASSSLSPSMLFRGPPASGKGTAALELGRVLSCEEAGAWNCGCSHCARHRVLSHPDLLAIGSRSFLPEIAAAASVFSREYTEMTARLFFIRAVRKLLLRFDPRLWEDDPAAKKIGPLADALDNDLNDILVFHEQGGEGEGNERAEKIAASVQKHSLALESEGISSQVPVIRIRRASWWCRMAPFGKRKLLLIENADQMQDSARNALLKILEEPPETAVIVLCSSRPQALLPTVLSRLRPYYFARREEAVEREVIRRVFRAGDSFQEGQPPSGGAGGLIAAYLDSFLSLSGEKLYPLAALFAASLCQRGLELLQSRGRSSLAPAMESLAAFTSRAAGLREGAPPEIPAPAACLKQVCAETRNFEGGIFPRFLGQILEAALRSRRGDIGAGRESDGAFAEIWSDLVREAALAAGTYNLAPALVLDRLGTDFLRRISALYGAV